jgi:hypothetical protein
MQAGATPDVELVDCLLLTAGVDDGAALIDDTLPPETQRT